MKNGLFGKLLLLGLAVIMLFALSSCEKNEAVEYDITGKSDFTVADTTFDGDVVITGEGGSVMFVNCVFNGNIINKGGEGARAILTEDCKFSDGSECVIESSLKEATMGTDLPKFLIFCEVPPVSCKTCGAVVTVSENEIEFNGEKYAIENAELFNNDATDEIVPFSGQKANMHNVAKWTENGEEINLHLAIFAE
ncbi:MAG: hypothetical protein IJ493_01540 [Clostridia bacterium]|nr:hypothetical protein [Clostridia bacterium]